MALAMKINASNTAKITALLADVQTGCHARTLDTEDVQAAAHDAEQTLDNAGIPQNMRQGATARMLPPQVAKGYHGSAMGTTVAMQRGGRDWFVVGAGRTYAGKCAYGSNGRLRISVAHHAELLDAMARKRGLEITRTEEQRQWQSLCPEGE